MEKSGVDQIEQELCGGVRRFVSKYSSGDPVRKADMTVLSSMHPKREICFVLAGASRYMLNNCLHDATPGTIFLIDQWVPHAFGYESTDHDLLHLWLYFDEKEVRGIFSQVLKHGEYIFCTQRLFLPLEYKNLINRRWNLLNAEAVITDDLVRYYLLSPINALLEEVAIQMKQQESLSADGDRIGPVVETIKQHIQMSNGRNCSYRKLAELSGFSRYYLAHSFRKDVGITIGSYVEQIRVEYTAAALEKGMKQKEIAAELGFSTPANFWNWLRRHKQFAPAKKK